MSDGTVREVTLLMTMPEAAAFAEKVTALQARYGTTSLTATVQRAIREAVDA